MDENIFLFVPNIIGYVRIILATCSLYYMPLHPRSCSLLYALSCLLDALDGFAARLLDQSTRFGAVLDMVTDRCTTTCLLVFLAVAYPAYALVFQILISLDYTSHFLHMYATLVTGGSDHKNMAARSNRLLNFYYNQWVLFTCCALNELFFIGLYLLCFSSPDSSIPLILPEPLRWFKPDLSSGRGVPHQLAFSAAAMEVARANKLNNTVPWIITLSSLPVMLFKQTVNVVQLVNAITQVVAIDKRDRDQDRQKKRS